MVPRLTAHLEQYAKSMKSVARYSNATSPLRVSSWHVQTVRSPIAGSSTSGSATHTQCCHHHPTVAHSALKPPTTASSPAAAVGLVSQCQPEASSPELRRRLAQRARPSPAPHSSRRKRAETTVEFDRRSGQPRELASAAAARVGLSVPPTRPSINSTTTRSATRGSRLAVTVADFAVLSHCRVRQEQRCREARTRTVGTPSNERRTAGRRVVGIRFRKPGCPWPGMPGGDSRRRAPPCSSGWRAPSFVSGSIDLSVGHRANDDAEPPGIDRPDPAAAAVIL